MNLWVLVKYNKNLKLIKIEIKKNLICNEILWYVKSWYLKFENVCFKENLFLFYLEIILE